VLFAVSFNSFVGDFFNDAPGSGSFDLRRGDGDSFESFLSTLIAG